jgi:hypothetical protein
MQTQHRRQRPLTADDYVVRRLAEETHTSEDEARRAFEDQLEALTSEARVTVFLTALARRRALEILKRAH